MGLAGQFARTRRLLRNDQALMAVVAAIVGILVAYAAIGFRMSISSVQWLSYGVFADRLVSRLAELPMWQILLVPTAGGLLVGLFLHFLMPGGRPMGVAHVIEAMALRNGRMRLLDGIAAACVSIVSLGVGASAGREGPMVHLGASIAGGVTQRLGLSPHLARTLLGCGVAAAVAAFLLRNTFTVSQAGYAGVAVTALIASGGLVIPVPLQVPPAVAAVKS